MSDALELKKQDDETASMVIVTPAESTSGEKKADSVDETKSEETKEAEKIATGALAETKDLYAKYDAEGNRSWTAEHPDNVEEAAENAETLKYAVIVRKSQLSILRRKRKLLTRRLRET